MVSSNCTVYSSKKSRLIKEQEVSEEGRSFSRSYFVLEVLIS